MSADLPEPFSGYEDSADVDDRPASDPTRGLVSLGFLGAALRRGTRLWCGLAVVGFLVGGAYYVASPPAQKADVSILLVDEPGVNPADEIQTDLALAESAPVAAGVIHQLGLSQTPASFSGTYLVSAVTDQILEITVSAPTSAEAVQRASAVATQFLKFRTAYEQTQLQQTEAQLNQQVAQAQQHLNSITTQIKQESSQPSATQQAQRLAASNTLASVQQYATQTLASTRTTTSQVVNGTQVLNRAVAIKQSRVKGVVIDAAGGLIAGLAVGMAIIVIGAITSDRLRRRDDIAYAFGAPVGLSIGPLRERRWMPDLGGRSAIRQRQMERVVEYLRNSVPGSSSRPTALGVVAVDDVPTAARAVVALAVSSAKEHNMRVVLADLSANAQAAHSLGVDSPGVSTVTPDGTRIMVVVPAVDDVAPIGPLQGPSSPQAKQGNREADESLGAVCARADLVLSLITLDPALGGDHLATWATDVVAMVTAGRSTEVRIHTVGDMIRIAQARLSSVIVIDADKSDESLGATSATSH
jgi:capsular polysaccharide biosynthesis protein